MGGRCVVGLVVKLNCRPADQQSIPSVSHFTGRPADPQTGTPDTGGLADRHTGGLADRHTGIPAVHSVSNPFYQ